MELTLDNLISFIKNKSYDEDEIFPSSIVRNDFNVEFDGDEVLYLFQELGVEFNVSFDTFNFKQYFLEETELCTLISFDTLFKKKKVREIEKELTIQDLFNFMENNKK
ncbi:DUF1493 family protein [Flavobacterium lacisediminis]|uniref:DUF1493 family protein n=1 Tax=Flavobacterium lacisediminis TaxID=2989705 RepID=A0ABT3EF11_9FLAO|nr:DUF1493 family protein [Flavobacterium lacisediminis]MCW1147156.1 DUF1493 family protein [Flavobacterium lacisediminis]